MILPRQIRITKLEYLKNDSRTYACRYTVVTPKLILIGSKGLDYDEGLPRYHFKTKESNF